MSTEKPAAKGSKGRLLMLRLLLGAPVIATPLLWFGALFAFLAHGITPVQQLHVLAVAAYPIVYLVGFINSRVHSRRDDFEAATSVMVKVLIYLVVVLGLWPVIGFQ